MKIRRFTPGALALFVVASVLAWAAGPARDITFVVLSDLHYGLTQWDDNDAPLKKVIDRLNSLPGTPLPDAVGGEPFPTPRGVIIPGDLTDGGSHRHWSGINLLVVDRDGFDDDIGVLGEKKLRYPAYEGYGNHDVLASEQAFVLSQIKKRNAKRQAVTVSSNHYHYSWDWDDVHFIQLNLYPGGSGPARNSISFLKEDLARAVGKSGRPVIIIHHYGFDRFSLGFWSEAERETYFQVIKDYRIAAIFHGHSHELEFQSWKGIPAISAGVARRQEFLAVRIKDNTMTVSAWAGDLWREARKFFLK